MRTLLDRRVNGTVCVSNVLQTTATDDDDGTAPAGSYTKRLFDDEALLASKLHEEADELLQAREKHDVAAEAADVVYFALVAAARAVTVAIILAVFVWRSAAYHWTTMVGQGVDITDIERQLERRTVRVRRRRGDAKPERAELDAKRQRLINEANGTTTTTTTATTTATATAKEHQ